MIFFGNFPNVVSSSSSIVINQYIHSSKSQIPNRTLNSHPIDTASWLFHLLKAAQVSQPITFAFGHLLGFALLQRAHVGRKLLADPQHRFEMLLPQSLLLLLRNEHCGPDAVADLAPVKRLPAPTVGHQPIELVALRDRNPRLAREVVGEDGPHFDPAGAVKLRETQGDVDAGLKGLVKSADAVGGEEENAIEVLQRSKED